MWGCPDATVRSSRAGSPLALPALPYPSPPPAPHTGNILLLNDGRIGLIDWGQVKRLSQADRVRLARLLIALADRDEVLSAQLMAATGFATRVCALPLAGRKAVHPTSPPPPHPPSGPAGCLPWPDPSSPTAV
eukprot:scaffold9748_cov93-Isochrysis_galbana.AAC.3